LGGTEMHLNLPILEVVAECKNILVAGMGRGFDVFCGLPLYFELKEQRRTVHLASFSFSDILHHHAGTELSETLKGIGKASSAPTVYFPELYLAQWFASEMNEEVLI
jgi:hypothetical protein